MTPVAALAVLVLAAAPVAPTDVMWVRKPAADRLPPLSTEIREPRSGRVELDCQILASGLLDDCQVVSETPKGHGLAAWTIKVAALFQAAPLSKSGVPVAGRRITIPFRFDPPTDAPSPAPEALPQ